MTVITRTYQRLIQSLIAFEGVSESLPPQPGSDLSWSEAGKSLKRELELLHLLAPVASGSTSVTEKASPKSGDEIDTTLMHSLLKGTAQRLTQLARTQDTLPLDHLDQVSLEQFHSARRTVVIAAWRLLQSIERQTEEDSTIATSHAGGKVKI
jgi:hypothetical protein